MNASARSGQQPEAIQRGVDGAQYWGDKPLRELTVGYMTTTVGAIQAGYAEGWLTGAFECRIKDFNLILECRCLALCLLKNPKDQNVRATVQKVGRSSTR